MTIPIIIRGDSAGNAPHPGVEGKREIFTGHECMGEKIDNNSPHHPLPFARSERLLHSIAVLRLPWLLLVGLLDVIVVVVLL